MKKLMIVAALLVGPRFAFADPISWQIPYLGTVQLPFQSNELVGGYDFLLHESVAGYSTPVATFWNEIEGSVGAVAVMGNATPIQPYLAAGVDIKKHLPMLAQFTSLHVGAFGRYDTGVGKPGAGISASYTF